MEVKTTSISSLDDEMRQGLRCPIFEYLPFWKWSNEDLTNKVKGILNDVCENCKFSVFAATLGGKCGGVNEEVDTCWGSHRRILYEKRNNYIKSFH